MNKLSNHAVKQIKKNTCPAIKGYTKKQIKAFINRKLRIDKDWAERACLAIYNQQTPPEKNSGISNGHNGAGFNKNDAPALTEIAKKLKNKRILKANEVKKLMYKMPKYACQIAHLSDRTKLKKELSHYYN